MATDRILTVAAVAFAIPAMQTLCGVDYDDLSLRGGAASLRIEASRSGHFGHEARHRDGANALGRIAR
jgi:hypothetical protein